MGITVKRVIELHKIMGHASGDKMAKAITEGCWINLPNENELTSQVINRVMNRINCLKIIVQIFILLYLVNVYIGR
jgi:hypothetical protein